MIRSDRIGSLGEPVDHREVPKFPGMAPRKSQSTLRKPSNQSEWLPGRANQPRGSLQISPNGSQGEPINHREVPKFPGMAPRKSHSTTGNPSDPPEWLSGRANQPCGSLQISSNGSQEEPINPAKAFKSVRMAPRKSQSTTGKPSDPPEWLFLRAMLAKTP